MMKKWHKKINGLRIEKGKNFHVKKNPVCHRRDRRTNYFFREIFRSVKTMII